MHERDRYLAELAERLRLPDDLRDEVVEEIAGHLEDAADAFTADGLASEDADRRAIDQLGPVELLATRIRRSHQTTRRLLAAVGGGIWAGGKDGLRGLLAGGLLGWFGWMLVMWVRQALGPMVGSAETAVEYRTTGTLISALALALGVAWGAEGFVIAAAARSRRRVEDVRRPIALAGSVILLVAVAVIDMDHNWLTVIVVGSLPLLFGIVAANADPQRTPDSPIRGLRGRWLLVAAAILVAGSGLVVVATRVVSGPTIPAVEGGSRDAAGWSDAGFDVIADSLVGDSSWAVRLTDRREQDGNVVASLDDTTQDWDAWRDLRVEAWRAMPDAWMTPRLAADATAPVLVAPIADPWDPAGTPIGVARSPGVSDYFIVVTGVDPATGRRVAFGWPEGETTAFRGSVLDWFAAL